MLPLFYRSWGNHKVVVWSNMTVIYRAGWQSVRVWHTYCPHCNEICNGPLYTGQEARASMAQHWARLHA